MQEEGLLFLLLKAAVLFLACFYHKAAVICVRKSQWCSSQATFLELSLPSKFAVSDSSQGIILLWTSHCVQHAPQASWCPCGERATPWTPSVCPSPAPSGMPQKVFPACLVLEQQRELVLHPVEGNHTLARGLTFKCGPLEGILSQSLEIL